MQFLTQNRLDHSTKLLLTRGNAELVNSPFNKKEIAIKKITPDPAVK